MNERWSVSYLSYAPTWSFHRQHHSGPLPEEAPPSHLYTGVEPERGEVYMVLQTPARSDQQECNAESLLLTDIQGHSSTGAGFSLLHLKIASACLPLCKV
jgi:hypothetical protein